jgi:hypothetical protein
MSHLKPRPLTVTYLTSLILIAVSTLAPAGAQAPDERPSLVQPATAGPSGTRIVNGIETNLLPSTVALVSPNGEQFCTGTLIGCSTVLTASHCVCESNGSACGPNGPDLTAASQIKIFAQHAGIFDVTSVTVPGNYVFGADADVAILKLANPVTGIGPSPINDVGRLPAGSRGLIAGFGLTMGGSADKGMKRFGLVTTSACTVVPGSEHLCWKFQNPVGSPGVDSNTCPGDSGGPLFVNFGDGLAVAGVTSGGLSQSCMPPDDSWDADVFVERSWIQSQAGADLSVATCADLGPAGELLGPIFIGAGAVDASAPTDNWLHEVPPGTDELRVSLNGVAGSQGVNDFDLYVKFGSAASSTNYDCSSEFPGNFETCNFSNPQAGTWNIQVKRFAGEGDYQLSTTNLTLNIFADGFESGDLSRW